MSKQKRNLENSGTPHKKNFKYTKVTKKLEHRSALNKILQPKLKVKAINPTICKFIIWTNAFAFWVEEKNEESTSLCRPRGIVREVFCRTSKATIPFSFWRWETQFWTLRRARRSNPSLKRLERLENMSICLTTRKEREAPKKKLEP